MQLCLISVGELLTGERDRKRLVGAPGAEFTKLVANL